MTVYRLYGLNVACDHPLPAPEARGTNVDLEVRLLVRGEEIPGDAPPGEVLAHVHLSYAHYFTTRDDGVHRMRFPGRCDIEISSDFSFVEIAVASEDLLSFGVLLIPGNLLATMLTLKRLCVLHGSAVHESQGAIGFIGPPGTGKSTLAAALCRTGMELVTDDVLVLDRSVNGFSCRLGPDRVRLRPSSQALLPDLRGKPTSDMRASVPLAQAPGQPSLRALALPRVQDGASSVAIEKLEPAAAVIELTRFPRTLGWKAADVLESSFRWNASIAREIPVYAVTLPRGSVLSDVNLTRLRSL